MCPPPTNDAVSTYARSNTWASGRYDSTRSSSTSLMDFTIPSAASETRPKLCITPLGCPVDPEV